MHHAYSIKGPTRDPTLRNCIPISSVPNPYNPLFFNFSCLLSIIICTSIHPLFISNWPLTYPWHPPLSSGAATITSIGTPRHLYRPTPSYIYVYPFSNLILLFPLHNTAIVATRRATAASRRHCPGSSGTHLPAALELLLAPPLTCLSWPHLKPRLDFTSGAHSPIAIDARFAHLYTHLSPLSSTTPPDVPFTCVRARDCLRVLAHHPIL